MLEMDLNLLTRDDPVAVSVGAGRSAETISVQSIRQKNISLQGTRLFRRPPKCITDQRTVRG